MTQAAVLAQMGNTNQTFRNRIINGAMMIDQRNAGAATANTINGYTIDRWYVSQTVTGKLIAQQNAGSVTPPSGFAKYLGVTSQSAYSILSSDQYYIDQAIEGLNAADLNWGTANAVTVTLSFWVRSSLTGTFGGAIANYAATRSYPFTYTINSANTWEQKSVTIPGDTSGTWLTTNSGFGYIFWGLGVGATYSGAANSWASAFYASATGATSVVGTNGATFYITGVQLEAGTTATPFEWRQYGTELLLCQRYFFRKDISSTNDILATIQAYAAGAAFGKLADLPVTMRATPTGSLSAIGSFRPNSAAGNSQAAFTAGTIDYLGTNQIGTQGFSGSSGLSAGNSTNITVSANAWIAASAEL